MDSDQDLQGFGPDLDSVPERSFEKVDFEKKVSRQKQKHEKLPSVQRVE